MDNERKKIMIESMVCITLPVRERMVFTISSLSVWSKLLSWSSVNDGRNEDNRVFCNPVIMESAMSSICFWLLISRDAASDMMSRMSNKTVSAVSYTHLRAHETDSYLV